jgi:hypothetical protein
LLAVRPFRQERDPGPGGKHPAPARAQLLDRDLEHRAPAMGRGTAEAGRTDQILVRLVRELRGGEVYGLHLAHREQRRQGPLAQRREQQPGPEARDHDDHEQQTPEEHLHLLYPDAISS